MKIGYKIKELRNAKGKTQKNIAEYLFVTPQAVSRWENDEVEPPLDIINKLADYFSVSIDYLLGKEKTVNVVEEYSNDQTIAKPVLAICEHCNKPIYESNEIIRKTSCVGTSVIRSVLCVQCNKQNEEIENKAKKKAIDKARLRSYIFGGLISGVALIMSLVYAISTGFESDSVSLIVISVLLFPFLSCLFLQNNFVGDMVEEIWSWGFIKFPGLIFSLSLDGIFWLLTVKLLFWIIGFILGAIALLFGIVLGLVVSVFVYPFALRKSYKESKLLS